jgi:hypothetical protein
MDIEKLQEFFFWCMLINLGIYIFTAIMIMVFHDTVLKIQRKMFRLDEETVSKAVYRYLANYKLLITVFNFVPWIAILIIK